MTLALRSMLLALSVPAVACGSDPIARSSPCQGGFVVGDLVITEIFADPAGADEGKEWFEIYNATGAAQDLAGVVLLRSKTDGTAAKEHVLGELAIDVDGYVVLGGVLDEVRPDHVDYAFGPDLGDLPNTSGLLSIGCGEEGTEFDIARWEAASEDASRGFDGARTPDATANDEIAAWCDATTPFTDELLGTPGARNDACFGAGVPTTCDDGGTIRDVVAPVVGDLVISEIHADPVAVDDGVGEWFEIYVGADVDLNGLSYGKTLEEPQGGLGSAACIRVTAGSYIVVAHDTDPEVNGGLPEVAGTFERALSNSDSTLVLGYGELELDATSWNGTDPGAANSLDPRYLDTEGNDDPAHFCAATTPYGAGDLGTPGAANDVECEIAPPDGQCFDGTAFIDVIAPGPGELVITELHANPEAVEDADGEWFELRANAPVHLNGLELGSVVGEPKDTIVAQDCIALGVGDYAVVAREADAATNGGLPVVHATFGFALANSDTGLYLASGGNVVDEVSWSSTAAGAATSLDGTFTSATDNDDEANWCAAVDPYGAGDLGTPGEENPQCAGTTPSSCLDGGERRMVVPPQLGDVVITELMPDPSAVGDADGEWFELLVLADVDLNGLELGTDPTDPDVTLPGSGDCLAIAAGTRVVLARDADPLVNGGLDPVLATFGFGLANCGGTLSVGYVGEVLDTVTWTGSDPGASISLDPDAEDPVANDDQGNFCSATTPYGAGDLGTPGAVGDDCGGGGGDGMCDDDGTPRAVVLPTLGDLVITESMANPNAVSDANGEWFELLVLADVDLNGLQLYTVDGALATDLEQTLDDGACLAVASGTRLLFARNATVAENGGLPTVDYVFGFGLVNSDAGVAVGVGDVVLDAVSWTTTAAGASRSLDPGSNDPAGNDDADAWCTGVPAYGDGDNGTPRAANDAC
ncbi:MAG: hypothetical protein IAG13_19070 [Deltaproteobacteria bacterium]|nr:hypothetical protein [Nannocystaceae bacterium]